MMQKIYLGLFSDRHAVAYVHKCSYAAKRFTLKWTNCDTILSRLVNVSLKHHQQKLETLQAF